MYIQVLLLVDKLREAFKDMIDELPWMAYTTKQVAKEKVRARGWELRYGGNALPYFNVNTWHGASLRRERSSVLNANTWHGASLRRERS